MIRIFLNWPFWVRSAVYFSFAAVYAYFGPQISLEYRILPAMIVTIMLPLCFYPEFLRAAAWHFQSQNVDILVTMVCNHALDLMPGNYHILLDQFDALMAKQRYEEAKAFSDRAASTAPEQWATWYRSALADLWLDDYESANDNVEKALKLAPGHWYALVVRAAVREANGDLKGCLEDCERIQLMGIVDASVRMLTSRVHISSANFEAAREVVSKVPKRLKAGSDDALTLAYFKFALNEFDEVLAICGQVPDAQRSAYWFLELHACCYRRLNEGALALRYISRAIKVRPDQSSCYEERALVFADAGMLNQALIGCKRIQVLGKKKKSRTAEAYVHFRSGEFKEMLDCTQSAITVSPKSAYAHALHSLALTGSGRFDEGMEEAVKATELHNLEAFAWYALANTHLKLDQFDQAIISLDTGLSADPHYRFSYQLRAEAHRRAGHTVEAERDQSKFDQLQAKFMANLDNT